MYKWLKSNTKELLLSLAISLLIALLFGSFMYFVGIPKTKARNEYNKAVIDLQRGNEESAMQHLEEALEYWDEKYIREALENLERAN